jgi:ATP-binding cassette, subfamily B, bacterial AbcA/BmrA
MKQENKERGLLQQIRDFIRLVRRAKVPWYLFFLSFISDALSATLFVKLPVLLGDIMQGEIFSGGEITQYGLMSLAQVAFAFFAVTVFNWVDLKIGVSAGVGIWNKIIQLPMRALDREKPSTLTSRVTDDSAGISLTISGFFNCLSTLYTIVLVYIEMFKMSVSLSLILLAVPLWLVISMAIIGGMSARSQQKIQDTLSAFTSYLSVRLPNMRIIKAFGMQDKERELGDEKIETQYHASMVLVGVNALAYALQSISTVICNVVVLVYGSYQVATGSMDVGDLITFFLFVTQGDFASYSEMLLMYYQNVRLGLGASAKIMEMMEMQDEQVEREKSFTVPEGELAFNHVTFAYEERPVLKDVSFSIPSGKTTAIVGTNGSGKTTLLKLLERFYSPDSGEITYGGENIERFHLNEWRDSVGYVVQNSPLLKGTVAENIAYGMEQPQQEEIEQAAKEAGAYDFVMKMDKAFQSEVGELGGQLSGGQRQKLAIARALVAHPDMVLLDEATCGLDACSERELQDTLGNTLAGKTVVMVAHSVDAVRNADQIVVLDQGQVVGTGNHESLLESCEAYRKFCAIA